MDTASLGIVSYISSVSFRPVSYVSYGRCCARTDMSDSRRLLVTVPVPLFHNRKTSIVFSNPPSVSGVLFTIKIHRVWHTKCCTSSTPRSSFQNFGQLHHDTCVSRPTSLKYILSDLLIRFQRGKTILFHRKVLFPASECCCFRGVLASQAEDSTFGVPFSGSCLSRYGFSCSDNLSLARKCTRVLDNCHGGEGS